MSEKSNDAAAAELARDLDLQPATARILANRGYADPDRARTFLAPSFSQLPDPALMKGMDAAVGVVMRALRENKRIVCHGDYDVDGVSGATILVEFLRGVGADVLPFIPDRSRHGYGFSRASLADCAALGAKVVITCDCGTASVNEVDEAAALGIEVVITDHHEPGPVLPRAAALLNPKQPGETFPDTDLCGTGVAFFLLIALRRALRESGQFATRPQPNLRAMLDIVTMAIIGDVVPLRGVNRILAREGMGILAAGSRIGIAALKEVAGSRDRFNEVSVAFALAPRINAAGRLGSAAAALDLLLCRDPVEAKRLAGLLDGENTRRREIEARMLDEALAQVASDPAVSSAPAIVLASDRWHMGVVGIIAARMVDRFHRPSMVLAIGDAGPDGRRLARGSARSIRGFDLYKGLTLCAEHMVGYGGHPMAAGMTVAESEIPALRTAFIREAAAVLGADDFMPELTIDCAVETGDLHERLVDELIGLGPHGASNPEPVLLLRNARVAQSRIVGKNHLRMDLATARGRLEAIAFGFGGCQPTLPDHLDVAFVPQRREYNGRTFTELRVRDLSLGNIRFEGSAPEPPPGIVGCPSASSSPRTPALP